MMLLFLSQVACICMEINLLFMAFSSNNRRDFNKPATEMAPRERRTKHIPARVGATRWGVASDYKNDEGVSEGWWIIGWNEGVG